ncbi:MAG TPA: hypothetical protein VFG58_02570 [Solirubrobacterales bacterium]|nr:hypothetical protein [Solirubrobacterales bacterium]
MSHRIARIFALSAVSAAFAVTGLGAGTATADRDHPEDGVHHGRHHHHCKHLQGKKRRHCERHHHGRHGDDGANHT